jgi:hypothetical protein
VILIYTITNFRLSLSALGLEPNHQFYDSDYLYRFAPATAGGAGFSDQSQTQSGPSPVLSSYFGSGTNASRSYSVGGRLRESSTSDSTMRDSDAYFGAQSAGGSSSGRSAINRLRGRSAAGGTKQVLVQAGMLNTLDECLGIGV